MNAVIDVAIQVVLLLALLGALCMGAFGMWHLMPREGRETLHSVVRWVSGRRTSVRSGQPVYAVHVDGQLRYASGKEDVQDFLGTTMVMASRQVLRLVATEHQATIVLTGGKESIVIEVHLT
jgi:hypothetical protein